jgi:hypothetical protein
LLNRNAAHRPAPHRHLTRHPFCGVDEAGLNWDLNHMHPSANLADKTRTAPAAAAYAWRWWWDDSPAAARAHRW